MERAQRALDLGDETFALGCISKICGEWSDRRMLSGKRIKSIGAASGDSNRGACMGEYECHAMAETRGCAGDQRGAPR